MKLSNLWIQTLGKTLYSLIGQLNVLYVKCRLLNEQYPLFYIIPRIETDVK